MISSVKFYSLDNKILFINPPISLDLRYGFLKNVANRLPNLGLACLASVARQKKWKTNIIDTAVLNISLNRLVDFIKEEKPSIVAITVNTLSFPVVTLLAHKIKLELESVVVLVGGPHISISPQKSLEECSAIDIGVIGEGELTLIDILDYLEGSKNIEDIEGIVYREEGMVMFNKLRNPIRDLDSLPLPAWDLLPDIRRFYSPSIQCVKKLPAANLVLSRGCPYNCSFCDHSVFGYRIRTYSPGYVLIMIKDLINNFGIRDFAIHDECIFSDKENFLEICKLIIKEKLNISWTIQLRVDQVSLDYLKIMKKAGCWQVQVGIESGSDSILKLLNKNITRKEIKYSCDLIKKAGLSSKGFFMLGSPGESLKTIKESFIFALNLPLDDFQLTFFTPYLGAPIYREIGRWGKLISNNFSEMSGYNVVFLPYGLSANDLKFWFKKFYKKFYFRPRILIKHLFKMKEPSLWGLYLKSFKSVVELF